MRILPLLLVLAFALPAQAARLDFDVFRMGKGSPVVLVVAGIQGDEPGGFSAASLLATRYNILDGTVIVVPNLNFPSIILRSRGPSGDMNRKFATLDPDDPDFATVRRIQSMITSPEVQLILNLHDGSGFYRPNRESSMRNPDRWGQCVIIDQSELLHSPFGQLEFLAGAVTDSVNHRLLDKEHAFHVKNTRTGEGNLEMSKTLTWFSINRGKAAFGLEVSKDFNVGPRAYYHLLMIESFFRTVGIDFERTFPLSPQGVENALGQAAWVAFADRRIVLPLNDIRRQQAGTLPLPRGSLSVDVPNPIMAVTTDSDKVHVHYGNNTLTTFTPQWVEPDLALEAMPVIVDGVRRTVRFGELVTVRETFQVEAVPGYRVNAIGADLSPSDESGLRIGLKDFMPRYSLDNSGSTYRVETYRESRFAGMFLVRFSKALSATAPAALSPAVSRPESLLGW